MKVSFAFIVVAAVVVVVVLGGVNAPSCVLEKYKCNRSRVFSSFVRPPSLVERVSPVLSCDNIF